MAVRRLGYSQVLERELAKGTNLKEAMKRARAKSKVIPAAKKTPKRKKKVLVSRPIGYWGLRPLKRKKKAGK